MDNSELLDILNDLIETSKDGEYGFNTSADRAAGASIKQVLRSRGADCAKGAAELQRLVVQYGGKPEEGGTVAGAMHRGWVSVRDAVSDMSDHAILDECERGEDRALARYRKALKSDLPADVLALVQRQETGVKANHDQIKALRDSTATTS